MNYIDIIIGLLLLLAAIQGFIKGFINEIFSLAALILGIWGAINYSYILNDFIKDNFNTNYEHLNIISFIITLLMVIIVVKLAGSLINRIIETVVPGFLNKLAGMAFGIFRTVLILSIVIMVFDKIDNNVHIIPPQVKAESKLYPPIQNLVPSLFPSINNLNGSEEQDQKQDKDLLTRIKKSLNV